MLQLMMIYFGLTLSFAGAYGLFCKIERWWDKWKKRK